MVKFLLLHPISVFVFYAALSLTALIGLWYLPVSLLPDLDVPNIRILSAHSNASPEEIEEKILAPIRNKLMNIHGLEEMKSKASFEKGEIDLKFKYGVNIDYAFLEVNESIDRAVNFLPKDVARPRVIRKRTEDVPAIFLSIFFKKSSDVNDFYLLSRFTDQVVRRRLDQLPEVAIADIHGQISKQIEIVPNAHKMLTLGVSHEDLSKALKNSNLSFGSILVKQRNYQFLLRLGSPLQDVEDIKKTALLINNRVFHIEDLAEVRSVDKELGGSYLVNGASAISVAIIKSHQANIDDLQKQISSLVKQLNKENPSIEIKISRDNTDILRYTISNLENNLVFGCVLAISFVFLFYRNWRSSILVGLSILISILICLLSFLAFGLSINMITLSGIIMGLGLMIDNGIIVLDNIIQDHEENRDVLEACIKGTNEMIRPLLTSMLTTCSVFIPLVFLSGVSGALFYEQAISISIGLILSYLVSITFLPVAYYQIGKSRSIRTRNSNRFQELYTQSVGIVFAYPFRFFIIILILPFLGGVIGTKLPLTFLPNIPSPSIELLIDWKESLDQKVYKERTKNLIAHLGDRVKYYDAHFGEDQYLIYRTNGSSPSTTRLYLESESSHSIYEVKQQIDRFLETKHQGVYFEFRPRLSDFELLFPQQEEDILIQIYDGGQPIAKQRQLLEELKSQLVQQFQDLEFFELPIEERLLLEPDNRRLLLQKVSYTDLFSKLEYLLKGSNILNLNLSQEKTAVIIGQSMVNSVSDLLGQERIINQEGSAIPLYDLIEFRKIAGWRRIEASDQGRFLSLRIKTDNPAPVLRYLEQGDLSLDFPIAVQAAMYKGLELRKELLWVLFLALTLLYLIMTLQFESFIQPLIILFEIPISLTGSLLCLYVFGESLNVMAMIGMVVTVGIVINDSIIKVDTINTFIRQGQPLKSAIHLGGQKRLNPIIMTTLTTVLAVLPIFFTQDLGAVLQYPLVLTLSGGLLLGTLMSLYLIPISYYKIYQKKWDLDPAKR